MSKPYGKIPKKKPQSPPRTPGDGEALKIRIRGKDDVPLSMSEMQQGLYQTAKTLLSCGNVRAKRATLYINLIDEDGRHVGVDEISVYPYRSAADEHGV